MKHLLTVAVTATLLAVPAGAAQLECTALGTAVRYAAADGSALARDFSNVDATEFAVGAMMDFRLPTAGGPTAGVADAAAYVRCTVPDGMAAGVGSVAWVHRANSAVVRNESNRIVVERVELPGSLTPATNGAAGVRLGDVQWPVVPRSAVAVPVDLGGATGAVALRISGDVSQAQRTLIAVLDAVRVDVELAAVAVDETAALIERLAELLGVDAVVLRMILGGVR